MSLPTLQKPIKPWLTLSVSHLLQSPDERESQFFSFSHYAADLFHCIGVLLETSAATTSAPISAKSTAAVRPIPHPAPVITAISPDRALREIPRRSITVGFMPSFLPFACLPQIMAQIIPRDGAATTSLIISPKNRPMAGISGAHLRCRGRQSHLLYQGCKCGHQGSKYVLYDHCSCKVKMLVRMITIGSSLEVAFFDVGRA